MADDNFLSRWSRRKVQVQRGEMPAPEPEAELAPPPPAPVAQPPVASQPAEPAPLAADAPPPEPPPTLADVETLTPQADFSRFVKADVDPGVQRAALKKLWADPHYNVMDGLDVYIDDYNTPDPLPKSMLRQMVQSHLLGLFDEDPAATQPATAAATAPTEASTDAAAPAPAPPDALPAPTSETDEDPDLRLQPDDAAGPAGAGEGAGAHAGREP